MPSTAAPEKPELRRGQNKIDTQNRHAAPTLSPGHGDSASQLARAGANNLPGGQISADDQSSCAPGEIFNLRTHTREFMEGQDATDMAALAVAWASSIPIDDLRSAAEQVGREYLRQFIVNRRTQSVRAGSPKWQQAGDGNPADRLEQYLLAVPSGGFLCVLDCTPEQLRYNATMRRDKATAVLEEADRLDALADATERAKRKTPRTLNAQTVFSILVRGDGDE